MISKKILFIIVLLLINSLLFSAKKRRSTKRSFKSNAATAQKKHGKFNKFEIEFGYHLAIFPENAIENTKLFHSFQFLIQGIPKVKHPRDDIFLVLFGVAYTPLWVSNDLTVLQFHQLEAVFSLYALRTFYSKRRKYRNVNKAGGLFPLMRIGTGLSIDALNVDSFLSNNRSDFKSQIGVHYVLSLSLGLGYHLQRVRLPWLNFKTYYRMGFHLFNTQTHILEHSWNLSIGFSY